MGPRKAQSDKRHPLQGRYGRLTIIGGPIIQPSGQLLFPCRCDCGKELRVALEDLRSGHVQSCGCLSQKSPRLARIWNHMKQRCCNPNDAGYRYYGGRGITVCQEWQDDYIAFKNWALANGYQDNLTLDRDRKSVV